MNPEDDPEARIRELERPLAETARASELGSTQPSPYPYQHQYQPGGDAYPAPPPSYGAPYTGAPSRSSSGLRAFWVMAAVIVAGVLAAVGAIVVFAADRMSDGSAGLSPASTTPRAVTPPRSAPPGASVDDAPTAGPATPIPPAGAPLIVSGINVNRTITCNDSIVNISGVSNTIVITGHCASLTVSGVQNVVTVDAADTISASGLNNHVTYHSGSPKVTKGSSNIVEQG